MPIWFNLIKIEFADTFKNPIFNLSKFVTNKSSPTICKFCVLLKNLDHALQSFSPKGSSIDLILYFFTKFKYLLIDLSTEIIF